MVATMYDTGLHILAAEDTPEFVRIFMTWVVAPAFLAGSTWLVWALLTEKGRRAAAAAREGKVCPDCGYDIRASPHRCPECGLPSFDRREYLRALQEDWPDRRTRVRKPGPGEQLSLLVSTDDATEAECLRQQLNARGVPCRVQKSELWEQRGGIREMTTFRRVLVYARDSETATAYLWRARGLPAEIAAELARKDEQQAGNGVSV